jgi:hypothetical protein
MARDDYDETLEQDGEGRPGFFRRLIRTLFLAAFLLALALGGWSLYTFRDQVGGKPPWEWNGQEWNRWWAYTVTLGRQVSQEVAEKSKEAGEKAVEYGSKAIEKVKSIEWAKLGDTISEKTKALFGKKEEVVQKIEQQREKTDAGYAPKYPGEAGQAFDYGLDALEQGIKYWTVSLVESADAQKLDPKATEQAVKRFRMAVGNFEQAKQLKPDLTPELDTFLQQAKDYLEESLERQKKIEELLQAGATQPAAPAAAPVAGATPEAPPQ